MYAIADDLATEALQRYYNGPPGIEVFEPDIKLTPEKFRSVVINSFIGGYDKREKELEQEKIAAYDKLLATARLKEIKLPWWKRFLVKRL